MKYKGYAGKLLKVNLSKKSIKIVPLSEKLAENYIGGVGIAAKIISDLIKPGMDPLEEKNPLVFMTGPITGTIAPWSGRHCVASISPLTGIWGESYAGGTWGRELKKAGFDGIIITGKSDHLVYLKVDNQNVMIENAAFLKGKDTWQTDELIRKSFGKKVKTAAIGIAGENCVRFASIIHDGKASRAAGRCGMGAVMGSKNLKAVAVLGTGKVGAAYNHEFSVSAREVIPELVKEPEHRLKKSQAVFSMFIDDHRHGVNNWKGSELAGFKKAVMDELEKHARQDNPYLCAGCVTGCSESTVDDKGVRQTVWEVIAPLGSQCGITDMDTVKKANDLCNRHGMDTISAGGSISFAMECYEEGIITDEDTEGIKINFGNREAALCMLEKICKREGLGEILAQGVKKASALIGKGSEKFAIEGKGLEVPAHDPRAHNFLALAYATENRGAIHTGAADPKIEGFNLMNMEDVRFKLEDTAETVARGQDYAGILNSMVLCAFSHAGYAQNFSADGFMGITAREVTEWFRLVTGIEYDFDELMRCGERIFTLRRQINLKLGLDPKDNRLHERLAMLKRENSPAKDHLPPIEKLVDNYFKYRGWDEDGLIMAEKLKQLGL
jgi:aldehyde:ferredoxin oxidoreductase